ncbi:MAG: polyphenol oxidase family protein [Endomicrobium sp.]|jgi:YfiH family protein|nr:polyphenol oxidase family protein [Endomicrobium sp.]
MSKETFPHKHFTTTKTAGDMKDKAVRTAFLYSLGLNPINLVVAKQIHGNNVRIVNISSKDSIVGDCDGLITADKELVLGIYTADCIPLLVSAENGELKAAVHVGWRGLYGGIIENTFELLKDKFCADLKKTKVYIGPHIRSCCYEISNEMKSRFGIKPNSSKLDLSGILCNKLNKFEITDVFDIKLCTFHMENLFFSYRHSKCVERIISIIV